VGLHDRHARCFVGPDQGPDQGPRRTALVDRTPPRFFLQCLFRVTDLAPSEAGFNPRNLPPTSERFLIVGFPSTTPFFLQAISQFPVRPCIPTSLQ
jgi:hypothetical protein